MLKLEQFGGCQIVVSEIDEATDYYIARQSFSVAVRRWRGRIVALAGQVFRFFAQQDPDTSM